MLLRSQPHVLQHLWCFRCSYIPPEQDIHCTICILVLFYRDRNKNQLLCTTTLVFCMPPVSINNSLATCRYRINKVNYLLIKNCFLCLNCKDTGHLAYSNSITSIVQLQCLASSIWTGTKRMSVRTTPIYLLNGSLFAVCCENSFPCVSHQSRYLAPEDQKHNPGVG